MWLTAVISILAFAVVFAVVAIVLVIVLYREDLYSRYEKWYG